MHNLPSLNLIYIGIQCLLAYSREIDPFQTLNIDLFTKVVTFLNKPLPTGKIYVRGKSLDHSLKIFPVYSEKIPNEILGNIPK